jgi:plastocyanin
MKHPILVKTVSVLVLAGGAQAFAASLSGEFTFTGKPPSVALVYFKDEPAAAKAPAPEVDQKDKKFTKKLVVGSSGSKISFLNNDDVDHNIYANDAKSGVNFDVGLVPPKQTSKVDLTWKEGMVVKISCKIHPKMQSYIANVPGTHHAVVEFEPADRKVAFAIDNVPDKLSAVSIWFPKNDPIDVAVKKGESKSADILEKGKVEGSVSLVRK